MKKIFITLGFVGFLLWVILIIVGLSWYFTMTKHILSPHEFAIVREVLYRSHDGLLSMAQPPYKVRVINNYSEQSKSFSIQPYPFGLIELIQGYDEKIRSSFVLALWNRYEATGDKNDKNLVDILRVDIDYTVKNPDNYAVYLDPRKLPMINDFRHYLYFPKLLAMFEGVTIRNRKELFAYFVKYRLMSYIRFLLERKEITKKNIKKKFSPLFDKFFKYEERFIRNYFGIKIVKHKYSFDTDFLRNYRLFVTPPLDTNKK